MQVVGRTKRAGVVLAGAAVFSLAAATTSYACWPDAKGAAPVTAISARGMAHPDLEAHHGMLTKQAALTKRLTALAAFVASIRTKVDAIPAGTMLTATQAAHVRHKLAFASTVDSALAKLAAKPETTSAQQATIASISSALSAIVAKVKALLANGIKPEPAVATKPAARANALKTFLLGARQGRFHFGARGSWFRDGRFQRAGDGDGKCDGDHRR